MRARCVLSRCSMSLSCRSIRPGIRKQPVPSTSRAAAGAASPSAANTPPVSTTSRGAPAGPASSSEAAPFTTVTFRITTLSANKTPPALELSIPPAGRNCAITR